MELALLPTTKDQVQEILSTSRQITVIDELTQHDAVEAAELLETSVRDLERARKEAVDPHVKEQRRINCIHKELSTPMESELLRLRRLLGDYAAWQEAQARAEQAKKIEDLKIRDRELVDQIAASTSLDEVDQIREEHSRETARLQQEIMVRTEEPIVTVKETWEYEVTDIVELFKAHPEAVKMEEKRNVLLALLSAKNGIVPGVVSRKVMNGRVRR